jgi:hypothetical protein
MRRRQRQTLHCRSWHRSLWIHMRSEERFLERERTRLQWWRDHSPATVWSLGLVMVSTMKSIDQSWHFLQPERRTP